MYPSTKHALILACAIGFTAGKIDLDDRLRAAIRNSQERIATINAKALVREINAATAKTSDAT